MDLKNDKKQLEDTENIDKSYDENMYEAFEKKEEPKEEIKEEPEEEKKDDSSNSETTNTSSNSSDIVNHTYTYKEKEYNSGFLESHTTTTTGSKVSRIFLLFFYLLVIVVGVGVYYLLRSDKYAFYLKKEEVLISKGSSYQIELQPKDSRYFDYLNYNYKIADESIATVDKYGTVTAVGTGTTTLKISLKSGIGSKTMKINSQNITIDSVQLLADISGNLEKKSKINLYVDETVTLHATANDDKELNVTVQYSSSDTNVAIVDEFGNVTGKGPGVAVISGTKDGVLGSVTVEVKSKPSGKSSSTPAPSNPTSNPTNNPVITPAPGQPTTNPTSAPVITPVPGNPTVKPVVTPASGKTTPVPTIKPTTAPGKATPKPGNPTVKPVVTAAPTTVAKPHVKTVDIGITKTTKYVGDTLQLYAKVTPTDATGYREVWSSSKNDVATVTQSGLVVAKKAGTTYISVEVDGKTSKGQLIVKDRPSNNPTPAPTTKPVTPTTAPTNAPVNNPPAGQQFSASEIQISPITLTINKNGTGTFNLKVSKAAGLVKVGSSNTNVAKISVDSDLLASDAPICKESGKDLICFFDGVSKADTITYTVTGSGTGTATINVSLDDLGKVDGGSVTGTGKIGVLVK